MEKDIGTTYATATQRGLLEARRRRPRARDWVAGTFAGAITVLLFGHGLVPQANGVVLVIESFLPWLGVVIAALLIAVLLSKAWFGAIPMAAALICWCVVFLPVLMTGVAPASAEETLEEAASGWTVATQNLRAGNPDPGAAVEKLVESGADVVVLQELTGPTLERIFPLLDGTYGHRLTAGTVGVWSRYPLSQGEPLALGLGWSRAVSVQLESPDGPVQLYAVHLPSVRPGDVSSRNNGLAELTRIVEADTSSRMLVVGDFNTANTDRAFAPLLAILDDARAGFGFTWPARLPATRPDHILFRGFTMTGASVISSPGTDHLATMARLQPGTPRPTYPATNSTS
ncbi:endonuclease/exonuclease/phosphatase family protein [Arthrobacter sp. ISL-95]|uniref:endonuclease/exonuclease/phosphatase family protein n=1 Tax=Arthrobacter sp. ISL-95 TaxID=2819116 RepID=UPI001BEA856F|nr:endonuclease/exonuclease/phosphatase family protein [Arthrobacter sp. ISL-95]MBT2585201.1 endonuclease/exonuclease/phosphatase family protein [Arthrobacter sp. ISL-95]